jgi:hypothetical protein
MIVAAIAETGMSLKMHEGAWWLQLWGRGAQRLMCELLSFRKRRLLYCAFISLRPVNNVNDWHHPSLDRNRVFGVSDDVLEGRKNGAMWTWQRPVWAGVCSE